MRITSAIPELPPSKVRQALRGLPTAERYELIVKPLRYRKRPHLAAMTDFSARQVILQVPEPFFPFREIVPYGAKRAAGKQIRFLWLSEGVNFRTPREVLRFLYCHEWMHWYLRERLGQRSAAETACDRFALRNYRRTFVTEVDAEAALRARRSPRRS